MNYTNAATSRRRPAPSPAWRLIYSGVAAAGILFGGTLTYSNAVLADHPVGYWRLGESGGATAADSSGFGRDGTYIGGVTLGVPGAIPADPNTAVRFDGSGSYVDIAGGPFNFPNNFTLEAWVINNNTSVPPLIAPRFFSNRTFNGANSGGYGVGVLTNGAIRFTLFARQDINSSVVVPFDGLFHYVAVTFDSSNVAMIYLDGVLRQTAIASRPAGNSTTDLLIGRSIAGDPDWRGVIDEAAIYNYVLTSDQIGSHYAAAVPEPRTFGLLGLASLFLLCAGPTKEHRKSSPGRSIYRRGLS